MGCVRRGEVISLSQRHQQRLPGGGNRSKSHMGHNGQAGWSEDTSEQKHSLEDAPGM